MQIKLFQELYQNVWKDPGDSRQRKDRVLQINQSVTELDHLQKKVSAGAEGVNFLAPSGSGSLCHTQRMEGACFRSPSISLSSLSLSLSHFPLSLSVFLSCYDSDSPRRIICLSLFLSLSHCDLFTLSNFQLKSMLHVLFFSFISLPRSDPSNR